MRTIVTLLILAVLAYGGWMFWQGNSDIKSMLPKNISIPFLNQVGKSSSGNNNAEPAGDFSSLEARYKPEQIIDKHFKSLSDDNERDLLSPSTLYYPYVLMEVKYTKDSKATGEGQMLWGLEDGEMVINATNWDTTHGFEDCINAHASTDDFKIINVLAKHGGIMDRESLLNALHVESHSLDKWIEDLRDKKLVVLSGNHYRLHFENPRLNIIPETRLKDPIVAQNVQGADRIKAHYSIAEVEQLTKAAFGQDFFIRREKEVYLPVYSIGIKNPDGSILTTFWNAYTGTRFKVE